MKTTIKNVWDMLLVAGHNHATVDYCMPLEGKDGYKVKLVFTPYGERVPIKFVFSAEGELDSMHVGRVETEEVTKTVVRKYILADSNMWKRLEEALDADSIKEFYEDSEKSLEELEALFKRIDEDRKKDEG